MKKPALKLSPFFSFLIVIFLTQQAFAYQPAVVSANPAASRVGVEILKKGGSAADAVVAMAFALTVAEPYNSGLGGGGFLLYFDARKKSFSFIDYREVAPAQSDAEVFSGNREKIEHGILSVAVPGFPLGMEAIYKKWHRLPWASLVQPAIDLAVGGIPLRGMLRQKIGKSAGLLLKNPDAEKIFLPPFRNSAKKIIQTDLAGTLTGIKTGGSRFFYRGRFARSLTRFMKKNGGLISREDMSSYRVLFRKPHQFAYGDYIVTSAPLPSSGGIGLNMLFNKAMINELAKYAPYSADVYRILLDDFRGYFDYREIALGDTKNNVISHTTHLCAVDSRGNIASMTNTLNDSFGSGLVVPGTGVLLNNEMGDFSLEKNTANRLKPGMRPLSSMSPTIVLEKGKPVLAVGTPGGFTIPQNIFQVLFYSWEWNLSASDAIRLPKVYYTPKSDKIMVEEKMPGRIVKSIRAMGSYVETTPSVGNVQALVIKNARETIPVSDRRGEGTGFSLRLSP